MEPGRGTCLSMSQCIVNILDLLAVKNLCRASSIPPQNQKYVTLWDFQTEYISELLWGQNLNFLALLFEITVHRTFKNPEKYA